MLLQPSFRKNFGNLYSQFFFKSQKLECEELDILLNFIILKLLKELKES